MKFKLSKEEKEKQKEMLNEIGQLYQEQPEGWREKSAEITKRMEELFGIINH